MKRITALIIVMGLVFTSCGFILPNTAEIEIKNVGVTTEQEGMRIRIELLVDDLRRNYYYTEIREGKTSKIFEIVWWNAITTNAKFRYSGNGGDAKGNITVSDIKNFDKLVLTWETNDSSNTVTQIKREKK